MEYVLTEDDLTTESIGTNNTIYFTETTFADMLGMATPTNYIDNQIIIYNLEETTSSNWDVTTGYYFYTTNTDRLIFVVPNGTYANLTEAKADLVDTVVIYELATYLDYNETNNNAYDRSGSVIIDSDTTFNMYGGEITPLIKFELPLNTKAQLAKAIQMNVIQSKDIVEIEQRLDRAEDDVLSAKTKTDFITITQDVDLDTTESQVATNKTNADASKVITDEITITQPVNLDTIESDLLSAKTKTDFITVTQNVNLDTMETNSNLGRSVLVYSASGDGLLPESTTGTARTMTSIGSASYVEITYGHKSSGVLYQTETVKIHTDGSHYALFTADITDGTYDLIQWGAWFTMASTTSFKWYRGVKFLDGVRTEDLTSFRLIKIVAYYDN